MVSGLIFTLCNAFLFIGCSKNQRHFFIPWLVLMMIKLIIAYLIVLILLGSGILALVFSEKAKGNDAFHTGFYDIRPTGKIVN
jgi:hypothetical protein